ncbi:Sporulation kinase E [Enhygromyxa salina]|uniref:histidine kinase n=1 Tax=Enhygromyxa salina TaxID=215803 RepID=A0A2S9YE57_9BACT|nr:ATP-binding protein [Enhygromyxa salina]PRQ03404.1 Sporulation kinase E [Enhygromyxa salina]
MPGDDPMLGAPWRESDFMERLLHNATTIVLLTDRDGRIVLFNDSMRALCGHELAEVRGEDWLELLVPSDERPRLRERYAAALADDEAWSEAVVTPIQTKSGELRSIEWTVDVVRDPGGGVLGIVSVGRDIGERLELRRRLAETKRLASVGMMASVFAHEVGNPLNAIFLQAQLLRRRAQKPEPGPLVPKLDSILSEIKRLNSLLQDFRAYQHPSEVQLELTDLGAVLSGVRDALADRAAEGKVCFECEFDESPFVIGNTGKLQQVFLSLCKNSLDAMQGGGTLWLRARADGDRVRVEVEDQGVGIPAGVDVFAPFYTTKTSGMGFGLPLVREIIAAHGGEIDFVSQPEQGTTFTVTLLRRRPDPS